MYQEWRKLDSTSCLPCTKLAHPGRKNEMSSKIKAAGLRSHGRPERNYFGTKSVVPRNNLGHICPSTTTSQPRIWNSKISPLQQLINHASLLAPPPSHIIETYSSGLLPVHWQSILQYRRMRNHRMWSKVHRSAKMLCWPILEVGWQGGWVQETWLLYLWEPILFAQMYLYV